MTDNYKNSYKITDKDLISLSVSNVGHQKCIPGYQWGPGIRDHYLIHHIISGKGIYHTKHADYFLSAGDTFLISPFEEVYYRADSNVPWEYCWVGFTGHDAKKILQATCFYQNGPVHHSSNPDLIKDALFSIYDAHGSAFINALNMTGCLYHTLSLFLTEKNFAARDDSYRLYVSKGVEFIETNYSYPISVEDIANYVGISRSHLFRSFQMHLLLSPKEYLTNFRIQQACILLQKSRLSVDAVSSSVGYEDSLNFCKAFKKHKGVSPSQYAKSFQAG